MGLVEVWVIDPSALQETDALHLITSVAKQGFSGPARKVSALVKGFNCQINASNGGAILDLAILTRQKEQLRDYIEPSEYRGLQERHEALIKPVTLALIPSFSVSC